MKELVAKHLDELLYENFVPSNSYYSMGPIGQTPTADDVDVNPFNLDDPNVWGRLQAFVGSLNGSDYIDPNQPWLRLCVKLQFAAGLQVTPFQITAPGNYVIKVTTAQEGAFRTVFDFDGEHDSDICIMLSVGQTTDGKWSLAARLIHEYELDGADSQNITYIS